MEARECFGGGKHSPFARASCDVEVDLQVRGCILRLTSVLFLTRRSTCLVRFLSDRPACRLYDVARWCFDSVSQLLSKEYLRPRQLTSCTPSLPCQAHHPTRTGCGLPRQLWPGGWSVLRTRPYSQKKDEILVRNFQGQKYMLSSYERAIQKQFTAFYRM